MDPAMIRQVRSFNRMVTEGIGALHDRFLGRGRPLGESRLLWEIGSEGAEVRALRHRLGLDSGYVSRVLRSLERQGLVRIRSSRDDGRVRQALLTRAGLQERSELDRRSETLAGNILEPLSDRQRGSLIAAMSEVERLLQASRVRLAVEDAATAEARWCFEQYFAELAARFDGGFDPALTISADENEIMPPRGFLIIARLRGEPVGCGAVKLHGSQPAELKRMWIAPAVRGLGVGRRLLAELERVASRRGASVVHLETNRSLKEAIALYRRSGYVEVNAFNSEPYAHHWFEKQLRRRPAPDRRK
jgi:DNA-binding MarR family transcriptional regulator/N-acetylglutamate synthase-like GNAT family acetyltransferase